MRSSACSSARARSSLSLVVFEDLHWIDAETQALLESLVESLPTARLLLLVNYRPEYRHGWGGKTYYPQLRIDPLPPESAEELLEALLGSDAALEPLKRLLTERTEGNPFFLEESVRTLVETGGTGRRAWRLPAGQAARRPPDPRDGPGDPRRAHRPLAARGQAAAPVRRRHRQGRALRACWRRSPRSPKSDCARSSPISRRPSSSTRRASFPTSSTPSSTRSPMRSPTEASFTIAVGSSMPPSSRPWSTARRPPERAGGAARPSRGARGGVGEGRDPSLAGGTKRAGPGRHTARRWPSSSRRWRP